MLKNKKKNILINKIQIKWTLFFILMAFTLATNSWAQNTQMEKISPPPSEEEFMEGFGQIRDSVGLGKRIFNDRKETDTYRIYNEDGSLWYEFSSYKSSSLYYEENLKSEFKPILLKLPFGATLELVSESKNWYQVIINDETRDVKYVWKSDIMFAFSKWERQLSASVFVKFDKQKNLLRETPNGKIMDIKIPSDIEFFFKSKLAGDWLLVYQNLKSGERIAGWIRWKENNTLLIRFWDGEKLKLDSRLNE